MQSGRLRIIKMPFEVLSSRVFIIWCIGGWIVYYIFSAIWMNESFANFAVSLQTRPVMRLPYLLFLISGYLNMIRAAKDFVGKGKIRFVSWLVLPLGFMIFMTGFFLGLTTRHFNWVVLGEGAEIRPKWSSEVYRAGAIDPGFKERLLDIDMNSGMGVFRYEPTLTVYDKHSKPFTVGVFPATKIGDTYFHILNFGLAPGIRISEGENRKEEGYMPLKIIGAGSSDKFEIPPYPYSFIVSAEPEKTIRKGRLEASEYNLKDPFYSIRVFNGAKLIAEGNSRSPISFDNLTLSFFKPTIWVQLEIVKDYGYPVVVLGIFLIVIGIPIYLCGLAIDWWNSKGSP